MAELLSPGVIIQEVPFGPQPIEGVSTSTAGFVGEALYGPSEGPPTLVTSFPDFQRKFGGLVASKHLGYAIQGFFDNGGRRAYVARSVGSLATEGSIDLDSAGGTLTPILGNVTATTTADEYRFAVGSTVGLGLGPGASLVDRTNPASPVALEVVGVDPNTGVVTVATATDIAGRSGSQYFLGFGATGGASVVVLEARDVGSFSARLAVFVDATLAARAALQVRISATVYQLGDVSFLRIGQRVQLDRPGVGRAVAVVAGVNLGMRQVTLVSDPGADFTGGTLYAIEWRFSTSFDGAAVETVQTTTVPSEIASEIANRSQWLRITGSHSLDPATASGRPTLAMALPSQLTAGGDGTFSASSVIGSTGPTRSGLGAIEGQDGINLIATPGFTDPTVINALISQAERLKDRFAVFDSEDQGDVNDVMIQRGRYNSQYAAMYHPWLRVRDSITGSHIALPPSGHVVGAYARTDNDRGVFKAPANVVLRGVVGFSVDVSTGEQEILNPAGVNVLRRFDGLGNVIWGARTVTADTLWKYVPVRRLFIFIEQSIARGTRYAVFEPNALPLWARIRDSVTNFLTTQWRAGALFGETAEQAFFVKVDETTTTQADRDNGIVNILVGIAPVKPAEFVVFQIGQAPSSVIVAEG